MFHDTQPAALDDEGGLDAWAQFRVDDASEVLHLLQLLRDRSAPLGLSSPQGVAVRSQLWSLDPARQHLTFSADGGGPLVQRLAQDDEAVAVGYLDNVKLQFDLLDLVLVHANASCALRARVPGAIYRFQRRAAYRVRSFDRRAPKVLLRHPSLPDMRIGLRIVDLSTGGCALLLPDDVPALQPGTLLGGVRFELDGDTAFDAALRLLHVGAMHSGGGQRLGCEFVELPGPPRRALQRFIDQAQRRRPPALR